MKKPKIAVLSFPGNNCEVESLRAVKRGGMDAVFFRWNDDKEKLRDIDGYFIPGGFSYEDRGRAGMVAARDPLLAFISEEAERGKVVIGNCNGAQILVESGLIPLDTGLKMSLARNVLAEEAVGFLNEWVWITPTCARDRCATSDWEGSIQMPIAHGEGRFTTKDKDVIEEIRKNDQIAFSYCNEGGDVSEDPIVTPNGSVYAIAGICNPAGNVVALMPHPERTELGGPYFVSMRKWIEEKRGSSYTSNKSDVSGHSIPTERSPRSVEIFIDTIITNNEERTVEQAARRKVDSLKLKQLRYIAPSIKSARDILGDIAMFNSNKEVAFIRRDGAFFTWNSESKEEEKLDTSPLSGGISLLRRDDPDTGSAAVGGGETGICYVCSGVNEQKMYSGEVLEVFANPHASILERLV
jgi:phosphoribosylformylglycinamidine synthase subunit PurQ / glutaminase